MASVSIPTPIYHITHWEHLSSILQCGGLCCYTMIQAQNIPHTSIAQAAIQVRRARKKVPIAPFGTLHDYVPFYFSPRSPMLGSIQQGAVEGFTEGHAVMPFSEYFSAAGELDRVDWDVVNSWKWSATENDPDRTRRKQAEFLAHQFFPWALVTEIGVCSPAVAKEVNKLLTANASPPYPTIKVQKKWYYDTTPP